MYDTFRVCSIMCTDNLYVYVHRQLVRLCAPTTCNLIFMSLWIFHACWSETIRDVQYEITRLSDLNTLKRAPWPLLNLIYLFIYSC